MITLDAKRAGEALGLQTLAAPVTGVTIDSRSIEPGDLFVALRGERFDGHDYVEAALAAGAAAAVVQEDSWTGHDTTDKPVYVVPDTLVALGALAREVRRASGVKVFGVTGSAGKTSTKDLLKAMVGRARRVVATLGNQNNEVGVPLTLLSVRDDTQAVVVEMGMRGLGQIAQLAAVAEPDVGIITNVHPVHLELLGSLDNIALAKSELVAGVRPGGAGVVPADRGALRPHLEANTCRLVTFGVGAPGESAEDPPEADVRGWLEPRPDGGHDWVVRWPEGETRVVTGHLPRHTLENAVAAVAGCYAAGLPMAECAAGLADVEFSHGRGQTVEAGGLFIIDDTYNANPAAVQAALDYLVSVAKKRQARAVAVLGDMLELGPEELSFHEQSGVQAAQAGVTALWGVGPLSEATVKGFTDWWTEHAQKGQQWSAQHLGSSEEADEVLAGLRAGDVVLAELLVAFDSRTW